MDRAERQRVILLILLSLLVGYVGYSGIGAFAGVEGMRAEVAKLREERDRLQRDVADAQRLVANLDRIRKERETLEAQLKELSRRLPLAHESAEVLRNVELLARKGNMAVAQVKRRPPRVQELYIELPMDINLTGGYQELVRFADQLAQLPRLVSLNEFKILARVAGGPPTGVPGVEVTPGSLVAQLVAVVYQALPVPGSSEAKTP